MEGPKCKHYEVCGLTADADPEAGLCILHSKQPDKDRKAFKEALKKHRKANGDDFRAFIFPDTVDFRDEEFADTVDFSNAEFLAEAHFFNASFHGQATFEKAKFNKRVDFDVATFANRADFSSAFFGADTTFEGTEFSSPSSLSRVTFSEQISFHKATFKQGVTFEGSNFAGRADFRNSSFQNRANFSDSVFVDKAEFDEAEFEGWTEFVGTKFNGGGDFLGTSFTGEKLSFAFSHFQERTLFRSRRDEQQDIVPIFEGDDVNFTQVTIHPPNVLIFRIADLSKCRFLETDLREVELTDVRWPRLGNRLVVYDEIVYLGKREVPPWGLLERLYRDLKQNCEDRRDYERAGDFHYGEKEIRRKNPDTSTLLRFFLTVYWLISGYGERYMRPIASAFVLLVVCAIGYLFLGIAPTEGSPLELKTLTDWILATALYSLQVITLLNPTDMQPIGFAAQALKVFQSIVGPVIIALFALALRQRLKR